MTAQYLRPLNWSMQKKRPHDWPSTTARLSSNDRIICLDRPTIPEACQNEFSEAGNTFGRGEIKPAGFLKNVSGFEGKDFGLLSKTFRRFSVLMLKLFC